MTEVFISLDQAIRRCVPMDFDSKMAISEAELRRIPAADVRPVAEAYWLRVKISLSSDAEIFLCAACADVAFRISKYCPNCGAKMKEVHDDGLLC